MPVQGTPGMAQGGDAWATAAPAEWHAGFAAARGDWGHQPRPLLATAPTPNDKDWAE